MRAGFVERMCTDGALVPVPAPAPVPVPVPWLAPGVEAGAVVGPVEGENDEAGDGGVEVIVWGAGCCNPS